MSRRRAGQSTLWRMYEIGGADLALRYHEISERARAAAPSADAPTLQRAVFINGVCISVEQVPALERACNSAIADGRYWYDARCGAWGSEGGPCAGFIQPGLTLGGASMASASGGDTGVYVNGRELHRQDAMRAIALWPGRYWLDAAGNFGFEGGWALGNLAVALGMPTAAPSGLDAFFNRRRRR